MRGAVAVAANPFAASIRMDSVLYDIYLHDPIEYIIQNEIWTGNTKFHCPKTNMFSRSSFGKGTRVSYNDMEITMKILILTILTTLSPHGTLFFSSHFL